MIEKFHTASVEETEGVAEEFAKKLNKSTPTFIAMYGDLGVEKFVVVTNNGYSNAALRRAHLGDENVEADVLSMVELHHMQGYGAMLYAGRNGVLLSPPFGWVVDNQISVHPGMLAVLYRRGVSFEEAMKKESLHIWYYGIRMMRYIRYKD